MSSEATAQVLALITSVLYASALVSARAGMRYSNPTTVTLVSILMQNLILWSAVLLTGGVPRVPPVAGILLFTLVGIFSTGRSPFCLYRCGKDRCFAQQRAPIREPADQRNDRHYDSRRTNVAFDHCRDSSYRRGNHRDFLETGATNT